jgi:hypothetical protein
MDNEAVLNKDIISVGGIDRLRRIMEIRKCSELDAIEFALVVGWAASEKRAFYLSKREGKKD